MEKIKAIVKAIRENKGIKEPFELTNTTSLRDDLGFDSFDLAELTVRLEDEFGIDVFETGLVENISDICKKIGIK